MCGDFGHHTAGYEIRRMINHLADEISEKAKEKGLVWKLSVDQNLPYLLGRGEEEQLQQTIRHLLLNAVKYTEHGAVTMSVKCEKLSEQEILLKVRIVDTGIGMTEEELTAFRSGMDDGMEVSSVHGKGTIFSITRKQMVEYWDVQSAMLGLLGKIQGIDVRAGIEACGTEETYLQVVQSFYETAEKQATQIKVYQEIADYRNYTIQVHSLKSSARLLGAMGLSEHAKKLEACGNAEDVNTIQDETPELLQEYLYYFEQLKPLFEQPDEENDNPLIDDKTLCEALMALSEVIEAFDFDSADAIMNTLSGYSIPKDFQKIYRELKTLMAEVARDDIMKIINTYLLCREEH